MKINYINHTQMKVKGFETLISNVFEYNKTKKIFNIIFVANEEIKKINKEYRGIDKVTDVITFALNDSSDMKDLSKQELGDIFICLDKAIEQATEYEHSIEREVGFLAVHGYLHLLGYDHMTKEDEEEMFQLQEEILTSANLRRNQS